MSDMIAFLCFLFAKIDDKKISGSDVAGYYGEQTVYKMDSGTLANYMKYSYKYDDQKRMTESETMKWNSQKNTWENDLRICYAYQGKSITTTYYKWNSKQKAYVLVPDMTVTMDNPSL